MHQVRLVHGNIFIDELNFVSAIVLGIRLYYLG